MSRENKILELIDKYLTYDKLDIEYDSFNMSLSNRLFNMLNLCNIFWDMRTKGNKDYESATRFLEAIGITLSKVLDSYAPKVTPEMALKKEIEVNGVNKKGVRPGKRTTMKFGRWLNQAYPFLTDTE